MKKLSTKTLAHLYRTFRMITGYRPGVADKLLLRKQAEREENGFEYTTVVEEFLESYFPNPRKLESIPAELWARESIFG